MNAHEFRDLVAGMDAAFLCDYLQVNSATLRRWKSGESKVPHAAIIALRLRLGGDLSAAFGDEWRGFLIDRYGHMYAPYHRRGFTPLQIAAMFFEVQELRHLRREVKRLADDLETSQQTAWASKKLGQLLQFREFTRHG